MMFSIHNRTENEETIAGKSTDAYFQEELTFYSVKIVFYEDELVKVNQHVRTGT